MPGIYYCTVLHFGLVEKLIVLELLTEGIHLQKWFHTHWEDRRDEVWGIQSRSHWEVYPDFPHQWLYHHLRNKQQAKYFKSKPHTDQALNSKLKKVCLA